jgi:hypothetical protein
MTIGTGIAVAGIAAAIGGAIASGHGADLVYVPLILLVLVFFV